MWTPQLSLTSGKSRHIWFWDSSCCEMRQRSNSHWNGNISTRVFIVRQPFSFRSLIHWRNVLISRQGAWISEIPVPTIQLMQPCSYHKALPLRILEPKSPVWMPRKWFCERSKCRKLLKPLKGWPVIKGDNQILHWIKNSILEWPSTALNVACLAIELQRSFIEFISFVFKSHCIIGYTSNKATHSQLDNRTLSHDLPLKLSHLSSINVPYPSPSTGKNPPVPDGPRSAVGSKIPESWFLAKFNRCNDGTAWKASGAMLLETTSPTSG